MVWHYHIVEPTGNDWRHERLKIGSRHWSSEIALLSQNSEARWSRPHTCDHIDAPASMNVSRFLTTAVGVTRSRRDRHQHEAMTSKTDVDEDRLLTRSIASNVTPSIKMMKISTTEQHHRLNELKCFFTIVFAVWIMKFAIRTLP